MPAVPRGMTAMDEERVMWQKENNITEVLLCVVGALHFRECSQQPCEGGTSGLTFKGKLRPREVT